LSGHLRLKRFDLGLRGLQGCCGVEPCYGGVKGSLPCTVVVCLLERDGRPDFEACGWKGKSEAARHDSDDRVWLATDLDGVSDDVSAGAEVLTPDGVAEDDCVFFAGVGEAVGVAAKART
jgi:hypothetical protein